VQYFRVALGLRKNHGPAMLGLAQTFLLRGDQPQAALWYRTYLKKFPTGPGAQEAQKKLPRLARRRTRVAHDAPGRGAASAEAGPESPAAEAPKDPPKGPPADSPSDE
jgi:hypothetical protein